MNLFDNFKIEVKAEPFKAVGYAFKKAFSSVEYDFNIQVFKSGIKNPLYALRVIADELVGNKISYFIQEKFGWFKKKTIPILFKDEELEFLANVFIGELTSFPFFFTGRRFLIVFKDFIQSKWLKPSFQNLFKILQVDHWREGLFKEKEYDGLAVNLRICWRPLLNFVEMGWLKHLCKNGWEGKTYNPTGYIPHDRNIEDFFELISRKAQEAIETDILELITLEDFCLTEDVKISKVGYNEFGAMKLNIGKLNLGKKKSKI